MPVLSETIIFEDLQSTHAISGFDCGDPDRNMWLHRHAVQNQGTDTRTYVAVEHGRVIGFHALCTGAVMRADVNATMRRNAPDPISSVILAQLAVDRSQQRRGIAKALVIHAMHLVVRLAELVGCRLFITHPANPNLDRFYANFGMTPFATQPPIMAMTVEKVRRTLDALSAPGSPSPRRSGPP